jgi:hypothetical protein
MKKNKRPRNAQKHNSSSVQRATRKIIFAQKNFFRITWNHQLEGSDFA